MDNTSRKRRYINESIKRPINGPFFHGESWYRCPKCLEDFEYYEAVFGSAFRQVDSKIYRHIKNHCGQLIDLT